MATIQTGEVVFYNGKFGFLRLPDGSSVFFPDSQLDKPTRQRLRLLDQVTFQSSLSLHGLHQGKPLATNVRWQATGDLSIHRRVVGILRPHNERFGRLQSPQLDKEVVMYYNRLLDRTALPLAGELVVFSPVVSSKNAQELFSFFAYPLSQEKDVAFLQQQLRDSGLPGLQTRLHEIAAGSSEISTEQRFAAELRQLGLVHSPEKYQQLGELLRKYAGQDYRPGIAALQATVAPVYQLLLWENRLVPDYVPALLLDYFLRASADRKRELILRLQPAERNRVLMALLDQLTSHGRISRLSNGVKTFLDVVYRNPETRDAELYDLAYQRLDLPATDWQKLAAHGYLAALPAKLVIVDAAQQEQLWLQRQEFAHLSPAAKAAQQAQLIEFYEQELAQTDLTTEAGQLHFALVGKLLMEFVPSAPQLVMQYWADFTPLQRLVWWTVGLEPIPATVSTDYQQLWPSLSVYLRLRYYLMQRDAHPRAEELDLSSLGIFAATYCHHRLVTIIDTKKDLPPQDSYYRLVDDVQELGLRWPAPLAVNTVIDHIYVALLPFQVEHIRMYLQDLVPEEAADFVGFRGPFRLLTGPEKLALKQRFDHRGQQEVEAHWQQQIMPCETWEEVDGQRCYTAYLENIYFGLGKMALRLEDGTFTPEFTGNVLLTEKAGRGLNALPVDSIYNELPMQVWVVDGVIRHVDGLGPLFDLLLEEEIAFTLAKLPPQTNGQVQIEAYAEDWQLREQVVAYLQQHATAEYIVREPRNYFRRLDDDSGIDAYETTALYTFPTSDGVGIVWENTDFSDDRSTYVFKAHPAELPAQLEKLKLAIGTYAQWRSALVGSQSRNELFGHYYGYLGRIRKLRGRNAPFAHWQQRLLEIITRLVPDMPTTEAWEQARRTGLSAGSFANKARPRTGPAIIDIRSLPTMDMETFASQPSTAAHPRTVDLEPTGKALLQALRAFNQYFAANLPEL